jgi:uncharacterized protein (TIGR02266 family)
MRNDRVRTRIPTEFEAGRLKGRGKVRNLSAGGLFVGTAAIPQQGETVRLSLSVPGESPVEVTGMVWWTTKEHRSHRTPGFGVQLLESNDDYDRILRDLE